MRTLLFCISLLLSVHANAQDLKAYQLLNAEGGAATFADIVKKSKKSDVVFFGELHNNPIAHWMQYELTKALHEEAKGSLVLGAEMFESDNQLLLTEYLNGTIPAKTFEDEARVWNNYKTDYKPLVDFALEKQLPFIATNIPRRYASLVFKGGFEALEGLAPEAQQYIAPSPVPYDPNLPGYVKMVEMMGGHGSGSANFPKAQAIKDATMAYFISQHLPEKGVFLHFNGSYHSDHYEGIVWYLKEAYAPKAKVLTITTLETDDLSAIPEGEQGKADFYLLVPSSMTKTY
ncbi:ChaN family lipoprotein [Phaeodactylibacter luteus]|uniref:ChaN family lipoprotein n=1 Tax=Phaeodactylibacter luteus TaxID=1564516 RepID=A0A5C6RKF1_9BACT|nr:ChaN family lipoprotein [Phaeodactylibacter luteus]TXB62703.1 ChaN family lipoprotein [Phaeodactylibacter luteus]